MRKRDIYSNYKEYKLSEPYVVQLDPTEGDALRDKEEKLSEFEEATIASEPVLGAENQPTPRETVLPELTLDESLFDEDVTPKYYFPEGCTYKVDAHSDNGQIMHFETQSIMEDWNDFEQSDEGSVFLEECGKNSSIFVRVHKYDECGVNEKYNFTQPIITEGIQPNDIDYITVGDKSYHVRKSFGKLKAISYDDEYWVPYERSATLEQNVDALRKEIEKCQEGLQESNGSIDTIIITDIEWSCDNDELPKSLILGIEDYTDEEEFKKMTFDVLKRVYDCEVLSFEYDNDNLPNKEIDEELVEPGEEEFEQLRSIFAQYGFVVESEHDNLFGGHHFQIINTDEGFEDEGEIKEFVRAMADDIDALSERINCPITYNYGVGTPITAGVDIREKYIDTSDSIDDVEETLSEEYRDSDIETDKEIKVVVNNRLIPLTIVEVSDKSRDGSQKVTFEMDGKTKQMWMKDFLKFINASDKSEE